MQGQRKIRVAVVFGGRSSEHAVSCASAGLILSAIDPDRYEVLPIGIATDGRWVLTSGDPARLALSAGSVPSVESVAVPRGRDHPADLVGRCFAGDEPWFGTTGPRFQWMSCLPLLHGAYGEDGTLQGLLEMTGTRYAGAGVFASAAGMDKEYMKLLMSARGLPVGRYVVVRDRDWRLLGERKRVLDEIAELGWPVFVKPARGGSSIGISRVSLSGDLEDAIEAAREHDPKVLVEAAVDGIEIECAVLEGLDGGPPEASVPGQVPPTPSQQPLGTPVFRTAAFSFGTAEEYRAVLNDEMPGYTYSRIDNPTVDAFARAVAALEGVNLPRWPAAQAFASGMAAISGVFWTFARTGAHVVASSAVYGGTYGFLRNVASRFGVETDFVDITDLDQVQAAIRPTTRIVYAETIANPTTAVADLRRLSEIAHDAGALLVVDSTLAPPVICRPLEHGADLVVHSATKYIGGHSDVTGGVVTGRIELISNIRSVRVDTGGCLAPDEAFLLRRGLETLPLRVRRACSTALVFAASLSRHPAVLRIDYPGLPEHSGHQVARRMFDAGPEGIRFGAIVTVTPHGGREAGMAFADKLRLAQNATSLGGTHTAVSHVASTTHRQLDDRALAAGGIDPGAVRFSIGLEDAEDLISDAYVALESLSRP